MTARTVGTESAVGTRARRVLDRVWGGRTRYLTDDRAAVDREFANVFVCRFDAEGRCREFTEWYMRRRPEALPD